MLNIITVLFRVLPCEFHWMCQHVILKISYKQDFAAAYLHGLQE